MPCALTRASAACCGVLGRRLDRSLSKALWLRRVLMTEPGLGIVRYVDAGYEKAIEEAKQHGVKIPLLNN